MKMGEVPLATIKTTLSFLSSCISSNDLIVYKGCHLLDLKTSLKEIIFDETFNIQMHFPIEIES